MTTTSGAEKGLRNGGMKQFNTTEYCRDGGKEEGWGAAVAER